MLLIRANPAPQPTVSSGATATLLAWGLLTAAVVAVVVFFVITRRRR
jgi:hypothetical protein